MLPSIHELSAEPDWDWDTNTKTKATGLLNSLKCGKNIVALVILVNSLDYVKGIAFKLQKRNLDVVVAYKLIGSAIKDIKDVRKNFDKVWNKWYYAAEVIAIDVGEEISLPRRCKFQKNRSNTPAETCSEYFKRSIGIPFIDDFISQLCKWFSIDNCKIQAIVSLIPEAVVKMDDKDLDDIHRKLLFWETDMPSSDTLRRELDRWRCYCFDIRKRRT